MNKKQTKIILFLGIILILAFFWWSLRVYQKKEAPVSVSPASKCDFLPKQIINFCKFDPFGSIEHLTEYEKVSFSETEQEQTIMMPVVHFGDKIIGRINLGEFLKQNPEIQQKIPSSVMVCLRTSSLTGERIFNPPVLQKYNRYNYGFYSCTTPLSSRNLGSLDFGGVIPVLNELQKKYNTFYFFVYLIDGKESQNISDDYKNLIKIIQQSSPLIATYLTVQ